MFAPFPRSEETNPGRYSPNFLGGGHNMSNLRY